MIANSDDKALADISKVLNYVLRHEREAIGLSLGPEGWAEINSLIAKANIPITHALLYAAVGKNDKKRFWELFQSRALEGAFSPSIKVHQLVRTRLVTKAGDHDF
ncbi:MAG: RNA 2'-phosphotransferase [Paracoccaceae bacterium]